MFDLNTFLTLAKEVGFPVFVAGYVLVRLNGKMDRLTNALHLLTHRVDRLLARMSGNQPPEEPQLHIVDDG